MHDARLPAPPIFGSRSKLLWEYVNATKKHISPAPISKDPQARHHPRGLSGLEIKTFCVHSKSNADLPGLPFLKT
jgi:hypothetical protein